VKLNLEDPAARRQLIGRPLDNVLDIAAKNGYSCLVIYDDLKSEEARRRELIVRVEDGRVTEIG